MSTVEEYLGKARRVFDSLLASSDECLSRAQIVETIGESHYSIIRGTLLATDKVESGAGRAGGLVVKRARGNRREWGQSAEIKARRYLQEMSLPVDDLSMRSLRQIYEYWPQSRIAEALSVSQATVSNWLRTGNVNPKYSDALQRLWAELKDEVEDKSDKGSRVIERRAEENQYADWLRAELERQGMNAVELAARTNIHVNTILALLEGRTEKPQQRTRQRIEKALQGQESAGLDQAPQHPAEQDTWYYIKLPWTNDEIDQVPDEPGVYAIHDRLGRPAYIGVAHKGAGGIRARLRKHNELRWTSDRKVANSFSYALSGRMPSSDPSQLARSLEKLLIKFMGNAILINERDVEDIAE